MHSMPNGKRYILDASGNPKVEPSARVWADFMNDPENLVIATTNLGPRGYVTTAFLGRDGRRPRRGGFTTQSGDLRLPLLWETRVHGGAFDGHNMRHADRVQALNGHGAMVKMCKGEL
jgi:hypothetical protein